MSVIKTVVGQMQLCCKVCTQLNMCVKYLFCYTKLVCTEIITQRKQTEQGNLRFDTSIRTQRVIFFFSLVSVSGRLANGHLRFLRAKASLELANVTFLERELL